MDNHMELRFCALPENEALARTVISAFILQENPSLSVLSEVRTAVSEAVTNAIVHAYKDKDGIVILRADLRDHELIIEIEDFGCGIQSIEQAMQPFFTTQPDLERTGIGFALMQSFMDDVCVSSVPGSGTCVTLKKRLEA